MLIVGLGNPGPEYEHNRHNVGFMVLDELARRWRAGSFRRQPKFEAEVCTAQHAGESRVLLKPQTYMNLSGRSVGKALAFYQRSLEDVVVVHDDIDLDFGRIRLKKGGGHGGHNGLRSLISTVGPDFVRVRIGVGRPPGEAHGNRSEKQVADYVLQDFHKTEKPELPFLIGEASDAVEAILERGLTLAMNRFNVREKSTGT
jgi:PTH1 family peptidyl-tRNA hydrolase